MSEGKIHTIRQELLEWYKGERKDLPWRTTEDLYKVLISEIFLQQMNTTSVKRLF